MEFVYVSSKESWHPSPVFSIERLIFFSLYAGVLICYTFTTIKVYVSHFEVFRIIKIMELDSP
jgi:hypothetical protein